MLKDLDWTQALATAEAELEVIHQRLREVLREHGHGTVSRVQQALGVSSGYLRRQRELKRLELGTLLKILRLIDMPLDIFFAPLHEQTGAGARFIRSAEKLRKLPEVQEAEKQFARQTEARKRDTP